MKFITPLLNYADVYSMLNAFMAEEAEPLILSYVVDIVLFLLLLNSLMYTYLKSFGVLALGNPVLKDFGLIGASPWY